MQGDFGKTAITVVDDEPFAQDVLVRAAKSWDFECQAAGSAEAALALLEKKPTPIVITDLRMPGRGGLWLVEQIRERWPDIGVIVVTAGQDVEAAYGCLGAGADHYFLKPIRLEEFRHALETTWRTYQLQRENARYRAKLERTLQIKTRKIRTTFLSGIDSLVRTMEERDPYTAGHSRRVRYYAAKLAVGIGLDRKLRKRLNLAAKLHDIGKVGIPEAILNKPDRLTQEEFARIQEHPVIGERILQPIVHIPMILQAIRGHHERLDGKGYPDGLRGDRIPLLARVIAVADCFDALTSSRAYRDPMSKEDALEILREGSGTQYEPAFVRTFLDVSNYFKVK